MMKKEEREHKRKQRIFRGFMGLVKPIVKWMCNVRFEKIKNVPEPYLLLCNHTTDLDCVLLGEVAQNHFYLVATEKLTRMGLVGHIIIKYFDPILHYKGKQGQNTIKAIFKHMKAGHNVAMFPEGNRTFNGETCPIPPATGKMARACGGTLVTYRFTGGYLTQPRWGRGVRKGKMEGHIAGIYSHDMLAAMSDEEIRNIIERDLYVDAYADQKANSVKYRGKNTAEGLESTLFECPQCGQIGKMGSKKDKWFCECGYSAYFDGYGMLKGNDGTEYTVTELDRKQREHVENIYRERLNAELKNETSAAIGTPNAAPIFTDSVFREIIGQDHNCISRDEVLMKAFTDRFVIGNVTVMFDDIEGLAINERNLLLIHVRGLNEHYECDGPSSLSTLKYLYLFRAARGSLNGIL